jgi:hypothetical protein
MTQLFSQMRMSCESFGADQIPEIFYLFGAIATINRKAPTFLRGLP